MIVSMLTSSRHQPRTLGEWFDKNVKFIFVALTAIGAAALVAIALNSTPTIAAGTPAGPIPTFSSSQPAKTTVAFIGDSYTAGTGSSSEATNFVTLVAKAKGWQATNLGRGGTGYMTTSGKAGCGLDYCPTYGEMIPEAVKIKPSIVVVSGGRNDGARPDLKASVSKFYSDLRAALPEAKIIALSPVWDDDPEPESIANLQTYVKAAAEAVGGSYVDAGEPLAGHPEFVVADGVHPNDAGYAAMAAAIDTALKALE